ncbi:Uncharacterised protein [Mycobacterium tuberculosis]|uniref:Uncharacterized protein n=1 Tax=Mycobacterium tuberculosis TaxID=1773 RepID=A0A0T9V9T2_MYCTX|nr:Uncharacterised protein [Mycobacterium tuberculosis]CKO00697.1 Uncharacterised protein [Mycobacterium tuberculosis]CKQ23700.1 Uncharacterised protein [Mycobacterium tuberculosis]CKQ39035.1 Uncharacterised protein [Mycobacterium tuberculosis]CKQ54756.1 Uncharacterised protein [Mycobacterium tuberculosis]
MLHGFPGGFQQQAVLRIDRYRFFLPDPEELGIKVSDVIEVRAPFAVGASGHAGFGVVVLVDVPAVGGDLGDQIVAPQQRLPQPIG